MFDQFSTAIEWIDLQETSLIAVWSNASTLFNFSYANNTCDYAPIYHGIIRCKGEASSSFNYGDDDYTVT